MVRRDNIISIDLKQYCTQQQYAKERGIKLNTLSQRIKRIKAGESKITIDFIEVPELNNLILINRLSK